MAQEMFLWYKKKSLVYDNLKNMIEPVNEANIQTYE